MHVHRGVRQSKALACLAGSQQHRAHAGGDTHRSGADRRFDHLHGVVDREASIDRAAGRIDVHLNVALGIFAAEVKQLCDDQIGDLVVDGRAQEDNALAQQQRVDIVGALAAGRGLDDHRNQ